MASLVCLAGCIFASLPVVIVCRSGSSVDTSPPLQLVVIVFDTNMKYIFGPVILVQNG